MKKLLKILGPLTFEAISISSIAIFLNLITSLAIAKSFQDQLGSSLLIWLLIISSILIFIPSFYLSKKLNKIFIVTKTDRESKIGSIKGVNISFYTLLLSIIGFVSLILILFLSNPNKGAKTDIEIKIGYQEIALYRHIFTAQEKGFFEDEGLKVNLISFASGNQMMEAFLSNQIDALGLTNLPVALTIEGKQKEQLKLINFLVWREDAYPDYIISRKKANISIPKDLEGKTVGLHPGSAVRAFSKTVFEHFNLDQSKIRTIELKPDVMQSTMIAGKVDAVYCMDPAATTLFLTGECDTLIQNPMQYIFPAPTPISGTAISTKLSKKNPELVIKLIRAIDKAIEYTREPGHENEIAEYIAKFTPINKEQALKMNPSVYWKYDEIQNNRVQAIAKKFFELGIVEKNINTDKILLQLDFEYKH